jgi:hypothetical protein
MTELVGMKEICGHMKRSETTVLSLHRDMDFPMRKIGGVWESDTELIAEWRRGLIKNGQTAENIQAIVPKRSSRGRANRQKMGASVL